MAKTDKAMTLFKFNNILQTYIIIGAMCIHVYEVDAHFYIVHKIDL